MIKALVNPACTPIDKITIAVGRLQGKACGRDILKPVFKNKGVRLHMCLFSSQLNLRIEKNSGMMAPVGLGTFKARYH